MKACLGSPRKTPPSGRVLGLSVDIPSPTLSPWPSGVWEGGVSRLAETFVGLGVQGSRFWPHDGSAGPMGPNTRLAASAERWTQGKTWGAQGKPGREAPPQLIPSPLCFGWSAMPQASPRPDEKATEERQPRGREDRIEAPAPEPRLSGH